MAENGTTAITFEVKDTRPAEESEPKQEVKNEEKQSLDEDEIKAKIEDQEKPLMEENEQEQEVKDFERVDIEIKGSNDENEGEFEQAKLANDVETEVMEKIFESLETSTPAKPNGIVNKQTGLNEEREVSKSVDDEGSLKRLMEVKTKLEFEAEARKLREEQRVEMRRKKNKKVTLGYETPDYFYVPRRVYNGRHTLNAFYFMTILGLKCICIYIYVENMTVSPSVIPSIRSIVYTRKPNTQMACMI